MNFKNLLKGFTTSLWDGEKTLLLSEDWIATKEDFMDPSTQIGWYVRCYLEGAIFGLAILGFIAKVKGYFKK